MVDKRLLVLALLFVVSLSLSLTFSKDILSEKGYGELLGKASFLSSFDAHALQALAVIASFLSSAILFFGLCGWGKECDEKIILPSAFVAILLLISPFVVQNMTLVDSPAEILSLPLFVLGAVVLFQEGNKRWLGIVPLLAGLALTYSYIQLPQTLDGTIVSGFPVLIALAFLGAGYYLSGKKKNLNEELIALVAGVISLFLLAPLSLAFFALASGMAMKKFMEEHGKIVLLVLVFSLALFLALPTTAKFASLIAAASLTVFAYVILSLYNFEVKGLVPYLMVALVAFSFSLVYFTINSERFAVADKYFVEALQYAKSKGIALAVLDYPNTYQFYMQKPATIVSGEELVSSDSPKYENILLSYRSLPHQMSKYPIAFLYYGTAKNSDGVTSELFYSERYVLVVTPNAEGKISTDGQLYNMNGGYVKSVPFTKIKLINEDSLTPSSVLVNIDGYEDTQIYGLLMTGETVFNDEGGKVIQVK
jgi:hypothetical protein